MGFLVQFIVTAIASQLFQLYGVLGGHSMGLILDARNSHFQDLWMAMLPREV